MRKLSERDIADFARDQADGIHAYLYESMEVDSETCERIEPRVKEAIQRIITQETSRYSVETWTQVVEPGIWHEGDAIRRAQELAQQQGRKLFVHRRDERGCSNRIATILPDGSWSREPAEANA